MIEVCIKTSEVGALTISGRYERTPDAAIWRLTHWHISFDSPSNPDERIVGSWYRVHGNQRKDMGLLLLRVGADFLNRHRVAAG